MNELQRLAVQHVARKLARICCKYDTNASYAIASVSHALGLNVGPSAQP